MKKSIFRTELALLMLPLLMGNAPAPWAPTVEIKNVEHGPFSYTTFRNEQGIKTEFTNLEENSFVRYVYANYEDSSISYNYYMEGELIPYNISKEIFFHTDKDDFDFSKIELYCEGYKEIRTDLVRLSEISGWEKTESYYGSHSTLTYTFDFSFLPLENFNNYYPIAKMIYDGEEHYYVSDYRIDGKLKQGIIYDEFRFSTIDDFDIKNVEVSEIMLVKGNHYYDKNGASRNIRIVIIIWSLMLFLVPGLAIGLVFLIRGIIKKNKKKKQTK